MNRRDLLSAAAAAVPVALALSPRLFAGAAAAGGFEVTRGEAEWRAMLTELEYAVMREQDTERAGSSPLDTETRAGTYLCKGCDLPLYASEAKYESGTGWPSFFRALPGAIGTKPDRGLVSLRTECHCRRCGSHLGHVFEDGPAPTGQRHSLNGVSLRFAPAA